MIRAYVALGGNVEPERRLPQAASLIAAQFPGARFSSAYRNPAVGFAGDDFINAAAAIDTSLGVPQLVQALHRIEEQCGRRRDDAKWAPRAMDLDLLLYGELVAELPEATLPRRDLLRRAFMLGPLTELAPSLVHPTAGRTLAELWRELEPAAPPLRKLLLRLGAAANGARNRPRQRG